ncbi:hypothetical protein CH63R_04648 [Colletotrichum higginsianum IMI 349063]|uniref:Major facilitator superfamily transporter n=2 Tax=Colletotrichum higginsianum TaxID=80884 RepID=A0A1B7YK70_COLHI|nr:hypothetical protein CH63R_04648 [Colletotrichum higginsianum IMI 349063]OBR12352.1 hypothetical protein CH63R_04648 [Colletotrichum higginsianum IMI 349063]TID00226.1 hypothetical protein CH35J_005521 [Colletotrichum higginsianum]GJC94038.1 hypothetical protein ColKHC_02864 [Colletotrichum higginsianum]
MAATAATAATTIYAHAFIMCKDPSSCQGSERSAYAGAVALAAGIANVGGILTLGPLQSAVRSNAKMGLFFWLISRGTSVAVLALAVVYRAMYLAFLGRIFEGFATDNLLHYNLGAIYVSVTEEGRFSRLIGTSLALFMVGMSLSPAIVSFLPNFFTSFVIALSVFVASIVYLALFVPMVSTWESPEDPRPGRDTRDGIADQKAKPFDLFRKAILVLRPLLYLWRDRRVALPGMALLLYNTTQAYLFPALMVYASLRYSFTGRENDCLISLAAGVSAIYLVVIFYILPKAKAWLGLGKPSKDAAGDGPAESPGSYREGSHRSKGATSTRHDFICAILSVSMQLLALPCIPFTTAGWQLFSLLAVISLGLAASSFIKSYGVSLAKKESAAVASLAMMESIGGLISAVVLGAVQTHAGEAMVFIWASALLGVSMAAMVLSEILRLRHSRS